MTLAFTLRQKYLPVLTKGVPLLYPVRRIYCYGQNYEAHARETSWSRTLTIPMFFTKPADTLAVAEDNFTQTTSVVQIRYPPLTESYYHEVELVVALGPPPDGGGCDYNDVPPEKVPQIIYGYSVGLDMTRRDLQGRAKQNGDPWDLAKGAEDGAVSSSLVRVADLRARCARLFVAHDGGPAEVVSCGDIRLSVNGTVRQCGDMECMITPVCDMVSLLSKYVTLRPGDLIYTGTPSGVGPVRRGDVIEASIDGVGALKATVV